MKTYDELPETVRADVDAITTACYSGGRAAADIEYKRICETRALKRYEALSLAQHALNRCLSLGYIGLV